MGLTAEYYVKSVYGTDREYPSNAVCRALVALSGRKTLDAHVKTIAQRDLSVEFVQVLPPKKTGGA